MNESWGGVFDRKFVITYPEGPVCLHGGLPTRILSAMIVRDDL